MALMTMYFEHDMRRLESIIRSDNSIHSLFFMNAFMSLRGRERADLRQFKNLPLFERNVFRLLPVLLTYPERDEQRLLQLEMDISNLRVSWEHKMRLAPMALRQTEIDDNDDL